MKKFDQTDLFNPAEEPKYAFDTSSFINFLSSSEGEPYSKDVMVSAWKHILKCLGSGKIVCPVAIYEELKKREDRIPELKEWLKVHRHCFVNIDQEQLGQAEPIARKYSVYGEQQGDYGDLMLMAFAKARSLKIITSEVRLDQHSPLRPKIPNVSDEFNIDCGSVIDFFRDENLKF